MLRPDSTKRLMAQPYPKPPKPSFGYPETAALVLIFRQNGSAPLFSTNSRHQSGPLPRQSPAIFAGFRQQGVERP
jgi:hypothetical protein